MENEEDRKQKKTEKTPSHAHWVIRVFLIAVALSASMSLCNFALKLASVSIGAIIYYIVIQLVLTLGFDANLLKLLSASVVAVFLAVPYWKGKYFSKPVKKAKEDAKNA